jgi:hypothetical protein
MRKMICLRQRDKKLRAFRAVSPFLLNSFTDTHAAHLSIAKKDQFASWKLMKSSA